MKFKWQQAPIRTAWGDDMVVASVAIDSDHTLSLYCERDQTPKVDAMFALAEQPAQQYNATSDHRLMEQPAQQEPGRNHWEDGDVFERIAAIKEQPAQQEPVAWLDEYGNAFPLAAKQYSVVGKHWKPLYTTTTPQRKPLTHEQIGQIILQQQITLVNYVCSDKQTEFARAIEAAHGIKEKNT